MPANSPHHEKQLLEQVAAGDEGAFKVLFDHYRGKLYHYVFSMIKSRESAEEIVTDVFMKIWTGRDMAAEIRNLNAFLFRIAYHKSIDFLRAAARNRALADLLWENVAARQASAQPAVSERTDGKIIMAEYEAALSKAVSLLPPRRREVYQLSREEGFSHEQIASLLNLSRHTINNHIVESRRFIQSFLLSRMNLFLLVLFLFR